MPNVDSLVTALNRCLFSCLNRNVKYGKGGGIDSDIFEFLFPHPLTDDFYRGGCNTTKFNGGREVINGNGAVYRVNGQNPNIVFGPEKSLEEEINRIKMELKNPSSSSITYKELRGKLFVYECRLRATRINLNCNELR